MKIIEMFNMNAKIRVIKHITWKNHSFSYWYASVLYQLIFVV